MLESVPPLVETLIYVYFGCVAALGCYLHARLWFGAQRRVRENRRDGPASTADADQSERKIR